MQDRRSAAERPRRQKAMLEKIGRRMTRLAAFFACVRRRSIDCFETVFPYGEGRAYSSNFNYSTLILH